MSRITQIHPSFTILRVQKNVKYLHPPKVSPSGLQTLKSKAKGKVKPFPRCVLRCNFFFCTVALVPDQMSNCAALFPRVDFQSHEQSESGRSASYLINTSSGPIVCAEETAFRVPKYSRYIRHRALSPQVHSLSSLDCALRRI